MSKSCQFFFSAPEMVMVLAPHIPKRDLLRCIQVSNSWYKQFLPYVWRSFTYGNTVRWRRIMSRMEKDSSELDRIKEIFDKHVHLIRNLDVTTEFFWEVFFINLKRKLEAMSTYPLNYLNLESVTLTPYFSYGHILTSEYENALISHCVSSLIPQSHLKSLTVKSVDWETKNISYKLKGILLLDSIMLPSLTRLEMDTLDMPAFDINFSSNVQEFVGNISESRTNFPPNNLRRITLNSKILYSTFINILQSAPGLDYFSVEEIDISDSDYDEISDGLEDIVPIFLGEPSQLRKLNYMSKKVASYKCISILAHLFPNLVEFTGEYLESNLSYALALNCKSIEKVIIAPKDERMTHNGVKMGVDVITIFLISCRKLKILDAKLLWVDVTEILDEPWVCDNLEELHCRFEGFPIVAGSSGGMFEKALQKSRQKEKLTRAEGEEVRQWQHSCRLKREVFKRISKLTSLRKLTLHSDARVDDLSQSVIRDICFRTRYVSERDGKMYIRYNNSPQDSISMRLDEGLDELASLTKLQYLGFENLEHHMGKEEIEWIAANLPSLKEMRGLLDGAQIGVEPNYKNRELLALMKSLRSDITHTRRYRPKDIEVPRRHFIDPRSEHFMVDSLLY